MRREFENDFNRNILRIIEDFSYNFYLIHPKPDITCKCVNFDTKESDANCKYCLGTGHKINIRTIKGAHQESAIPSSARDLKDITVARVYYIPYQYKVYKHDLIVDDDDVFFVHALQDEVAFHGEKIFQKCLTYSKKMQSIALMKNFKNIMGDRYVKNKVTKH